MSKRAVVLRTVPNYKKNIPISPAKIADFCRRWSITELAFFGSVLRDDFRPDSDVDVLVSFAPDAAWSLFDHVHMEDDLQTILGRDVDIVTRRSIERSSNWIRRQAILESAEPVYSDIPPLIAALEQVDAGARHSE